MKQKGYDGISGFDIHKNGMREPLMPLKKQKDLRLGFVPIKINVLSSKALSNKDVNALKDVNISIIATPNLMNMSGILVFLMTMTSTMSLMSLVRLVHTLPTSWILIFMLIPFTNLTHQRPQLEKHG